MPFVQCWRVEGDVTYLFFIKRVINSYKFLVKIKEHLGQLHYLEKKTKEFKLAILCKKTFFH